jgi:hypothetical protein
MCRPTSASFSGAAALAAAGPRSECDLGRQRPAQDDERQDARDRHGDAAASVRQAMATVARVRT